MSLRVRSCRRCAQTRCQILGRASEFLAERCLLIQHYWAGERQLQHITRETSCGASRLGLPHTRLAARVKFEDGLEGEVNLAHLVGRGVFKMWADDPSEFARLRVDNESGTVTWPGGLDVAPDAIYQRIVGATSGLKSKSKV